MGTQTDYEVFLTPHHYPEASKLESIASKFRQLRLQALQTDPASFSSSFITESQRPSSFFTNRLTNPIAKTFALIKAVPQSQSHIDPEYALDKPWLGMVVVLGPKVIDPTAYDNESTWKTVLTETSPLVDESKRARSVFAESPSANSALVYHFVSVYVAPQVRGKGLAKKLMSTALAVVEHETREKTFTQAICSIGVAKDNSIARRTYESMGFVGVAKDHFISEDGREGDDSVMRRDIHV